MREALPSSTSASPSGSVMTIDCVGIDVHAPRSRLPVGLAFGFGDEGLLPSFEGASLRLRGQAPTDPDVRISRIRLFMFWARTRHQGRMKPAGLGRAKRLRIKRI